MRRRDLIRSETPREVGTRFDKRVCRDRRAIFGHSPQVDSIVQSVSQRLSAALLAGAFSLSCGLNQGQEASRTVDELRESAPQTPATASDATSSNENTHDRAQDPELGEHSGAVSGGETIGGDNDAGQHEQAEPSGEDNPESLVLLEAEDTSLAGPHAGVVEQPFSGVGLYANDDGVSFAVTFPSIPGVYSIRVVGASSSTSTAKAEVLLDERSKGILGFTGTERQVQSADVTLKDGEIRTQTVALTATGDDGSWDLFIDSVEVLYLGPPPPRPPTPTPSAAPVWETGQYRNLFVELGKTQAEVDERVEAVVQQLFYGSDEERIYYEAGDDEAYFYTADTDDVRSEGMSYGMMISLQLNKQSEFDKLWKFAKTRMQHQTGDRAGYFAWRVRTDGTHMDANPAPDGEEYFAMALLMAAKRWGNGEGIYNYAAEANSLLDHIVNHREIIGLPEWSGTANMLDPVEKQIVFSTEGNSATFTDPSYHLPHFYELFARWSDKDNDLWLEVAERSRLLFRQACHESTGLAPDYCEFDGTPTGGAHAQFRFDAWRVAMNIALDSYWWNQDPWQRDIWVKNYLGFFAEQGVSSHRNQFNIDGTGAEGDHSPGLVAMNAVAALISNEDVAWEFVEEFWRVTPTTGNYRYYDGCLYLFGLLNVTGRYQIYGR